MTFERPLRVAVYTHASHAIGMGHLYRLRNLLLGLERRDPTVEVLLLVNEDPLAASFFGDLHGEVLAGDPARFGDWADAALAAFDPDVAIHDALRAEAALLPVLRYHAPCLITVDDTSDIARALCDLRINVLYQAPARAHDPPTWNALGDVFLHESFSAAAASYSYRETAHEVLVSQGGADTFGQLPKIVDALLPIAQLQLHVVAGMAFRHQDELEEAHRGSQRVTVHHDVRDMAGLMQRCDIAVSGGGMTLFELADVGVPTIAMTAEPVELETIARFDKRDLIVNLGLSDPFPRQNLKEAAAELLADKPRRQELGRRARKAVQGRGIERAVDYILDRRHDTSEEGA